MSAEPDVYNGRIQEAFSGDDLVILFDLERMNLFLRQRVRLEGVDTPSGIRMGQDTDAGRVRAFVMNQCRGHELEFTITSRGRNSWVGKLVVLSPEGRRDMNEELIQMGFPYELKGK